jgi:uncharacterized repeat protein (TIGR03803 family)
MTTPKYVAKPQHPDHGKSWMSPDAKHYKQLLYVSDWDTNDVYVFSYPRGAPVGRLTGFTEPYGQCVDSKGNVYISNFGAGSVVEYAHGGKRVIKTLTTGGSPIGCSIDENGDIAVTNFATPSGPGNVAIFQEGSGSPKSYGNNACYYMWPAGYDESGNLYAEGQNGTVSVCELPAGGSSMNTVSFNKTIYFPGSVMWDGEYITLTDQEYGGQYQAAIYQATEGSGTLTAEGATELSGNCSLHYVDVVQPFIVGKSNTPMNRRQGHVVEGGNLWCSASGSGSMNTWNYPAGGAPISQLDANAPYGESVSIAGSHDSPNRQHLAAPPKYTVLYSFNAGSGGGFSPFAGLVVMNGTLYGTTYNGGTGSGCGSFGCGTVFSISTSAAENVVHNFSNDGADGANPAANLIAVNGTLYGTTQNGGRYNGGTVFSITGSATESVLHSFGGTAGISDGKTPISSLLDVKGKLYGTTEFGGTNYEGTVFSLTTSGTERVLHSFSGSYRHGPDGGNPLAGLIAVNGTLYGTTSTGGNTDGAVGTAFSITTRGAETVLHDFQSYGLDGAEPYAPLVALTVSGTTKLYATTVAGGAHYNYGAICVMDTSGNESVLHTFGLGSDGRYPQDGLIVIKQTLYGTTTGGGIDSHGTVFSINASGTKELVLHSFAGGSADGEDPVASLVDLKGTLYGTTESGGTDGRGTVFSLKP